MKKETSVPTPSVKAKPLTPGGGQQEEDERDHEGHDVGVDDRRQAALVARRDGGRDRLPPRSSSLTRSKITMFASTATPMVKIRPAIPAGSS